MISDIHFDPFHDPGKFPQLNVAPAEKWQAILDTPASATQAADYAALSKTCKGKGVDTPEALLNSALEAMKSREPHPLFVTVSGDLMGHQFDCRFKQLAPTATEADYSAFAAKTVAFVSARLHATFPQSPIYLALGNNDSGCKDYSEDLSSAYLAAAAKSFAADVLDPANAAAIKREFLTEGDYSVLLPAPFEHTRLIVLQDIFEAAKYRDCAGKEPGYPYAAQLQSAWLLTQLKAARAAKEHVWLMAHIPPGIDAYSSLSSGKNVCGGEAPTMFLRDDELAFTLRDYADVLKLVLLGHTHMDEMRYYHGADGAAVPGKIVPSISPVNGNNPAFTIAQADPKLETLKDYKVYAATTEAASTWDKAPAWSEEYRYSTTYHQPDFSAASVSKIMLDFHSDPTGADASAYQRFYFVGTPAEGMKGAAKAAALSLVWPGYVCSITQTTEADFRRCACPASPPKKP